MNISLLKIFAFAILAIGTNQLKMAKAGDLDDAISETAETAEQKLNSAENKLAANKPDLNVNETQSDILNLDTADDDQNQDDEVTIPSVEELTNHSDPIALGQKIDKITDEDEKNELITELRNAYKENKDSIAGKFYQAVYASMINPQKASEFWNTALEKETKKVLKSGASIIDKVGVNGAIGNARQILQFDPLGIAIRRGDSILLTVLSDASKQIGKITALVYDTAGNVVGINRKVTARIQGIPFIGDVKNNIDDLVEEGIKRRKFIAESFANTGAKTFATLANDSAKIADERQERLTQFIDKSNQ